MKKSLGILCAALTLFVLAGFTLAVGGEAGDPLISLNFLNNDFLAQTEKKIDAGIQADDNALLTDATSRWNGAVASAQAVVNASYVPTWTEARVKQGDILSGFTGLQVLPLTGDLRVNFDSGAVVDVTDGTEVPSGSMLKSNHRYLVAEETTAVFTAVSKTAVINYCGTYHFHLSETPDYNAMARALKSLSLFRGTTTAYGAAMSCSTSLTPTLCIIWACSTARTRAMSWSEAPAVRNPSSCSSACWAKKKLRLPARLPTPLSTFLPGASLTSLTPTKRAIPMVSARIFSALTWNLSP